MIKRLRRDVFIYGSADLFARGLQLLALPVYTKYLTVTQFGQLALVTVSASILAMVMNFGVNNAVQRFYFEKNSNLGETKIIVSTGLTQLVIFGALISILALLLFTNINSFGISSFDDGRILYIIAICYILPEQITQYTQDILRLHFKPVKFFLVALVRSVLGLVIGLWLLTFWSMGVSGVLAGTLVGALLAVPLGLFLIRKDLAFEFKKATEIALLKFGGPFVLVGASYWIFQSMDRWMLAGLSGIREVGLFAVANKFAIIVSFATFAFNRAWAPYAFQLYANKGDYRQVISTVFSIWFFGISLFALTISIFGQELLWLTTPVDYWGAAWIISIMCAAMALDGTTIFTLLGISLEKRTFLMNYGTWLAALANFGLNWLLLPTYGAVGAAISALCAYGLLTSYFLWMSQRLHRLPLEWLKLAYALAIVFLSLLAPYALGLVSVSVVGIFLKLALLGVVVLGALAIGIINLGTAKQFFQRG